MMQRASRPPEAAQATHPEVVGKQMHCPALQALFPPEAVIGPDSLHVGVLWPGAYGPRDPVAADVDEARPLHEPLHVLGDVEALAELLAGLQRQGAPAAQVRAVQAPVVCAGRDADLGVLEPRAGPEVLEDLGVEGGVVGDAPVYAARVDEVERGRRAKGPGQREVVNLELEVGRDQGGLDGREVGGDDGGRGVLVGKVHGPEARPRAKVEDLLRAGSYGGQEELAAEGLGEEVVVEVEVVLRDVIIGAPCFLEHD